MIGEKCEYCGEKVLILKKVEEKNLCLDCYYEFKNKYSSSPLYNCKSGDRRCPNCDRIIPFDSVICPYCGKRFESFL
jgi:uncharacterized Zn-finger protein